MHTSQTCTRAQTQPHTNNKPSAFSACLPHELIFPGVAFPSWINRAARVGNAGQFHYLHTHKHTRAKFFIFFASHVAVGLGSPAAVPALASNGVSPADVPMHVPSAQHSSEHKTPSHPTKREWMCTQINCDVHTRPRIPWIFFSATGRERVGRERESERERSSGLLAEEYTPKIRTHKQTAARFTAPSRASMSPRCVYYY